MNNLKIGDKIKLKKLSEEEFEKLYIKKFNYNNDHFKQYLNAYNKCSNQIFEIERIDDFRIYCKSKVINDWLHEEEIEKINYLKTKFKIVNKILNNNI